MTYLVLGSNSFAGATYVDDLLRRGEKVIGVSRSQPPSPALKPYATNENIRQYTFHQLDLNLDFTAIKALIADTKPAYIVDFASQSMVAESWLNPDQWYTTNVVAKSRLHQFLLNCDFLIRYIRISTPEVYGHSDEKISETHPF